MKILHLLAKGGVGGMESLCVDIAKYSSDENYFWFVFDGGKNADAIIKITERAIIRHMEYRKVIAEYITFLRYCRNNKIECVIAQSEAPIILLFVFLIKHYYPQIKCVAYLHADGEVLFPKLQGKIIFKLCFGSLDGCIAISDFVKKSMKYLNVDSQKITVIYNGIDISRFLPVDETSKTTVKENHIDINTIEVPTIIYVGRLIYQKGLDILLDALPKVNYDFRLIIIGDGPEKENLIQHNKRLDLESKVEFYGDQENVQTFLRKATFFVHPARCEEGLGIAILEAMACGLPCIAFPKGGIPEIITDGKNGFFAERTSSDGLAQKINEVIGIYKNSPVIWKKIKECATKRAREFDFRTYVCMLHNYLERI